MYKQKFISRMRGYTLIELMIVVAIIGIVAAIAIPSYLQYYTKESRTEVQGTMVQIQQRLEAYKLVNNDYGASNAATYSNALKNPAIYGGTTFPLNSTGGAVKYTLAFNSAISGTAPSATWQLDASPVNSQVNNGTVSLNDQGQRCWTQGTTCTPGISTIWSN